MMNDKLNNDSSSYTALVNFQSESESRKRRSNSFGFPRASSDQMLQRFPRRMNNTPRHPRTGSLPGRGNMDFMPLSSKSAHEKIKRELQQQQEDPRPRSRTPTSTRRKGAAGIVQRSSSKFIKSTLLDLEQLCCSTTPQGDNCDDAQALFSALGVLREHAVDSYYQVIMRKHRGVETLQQVSSVFSSNSAIVELCNSTLEYLTLQDSNSKGIVRSSMDGVVIDFSTESPKTVLTRTLQGPATGETRGAPVLTVDTESNGH